MSISLERRYADRLEEFSARHAFLVDLAMVLALMGCAALGSSITLPSATPPDQDKTATVLMGVACLALLKHRTHPRTAVVVSGVSTVAAVALGYLVTPCCWHRSWRRSTGWPRSPTAGPPASTASPPWWR